MADSWIMKGLDWNNPLRIRSWQALEDWVEEVGFLPLFAGDIPGFSAEEHVSPDFWWTGNREQDPWEWRELIAAHHRLAYGKFFAGRAGFISRGWLPAFANFRRDGYDFDGKWQTGAASSREKAVMVHFMDVESEDEPVFYGKPLLSTELKRMAGFGKGGEKNYPGVLTGLQSQLYLVISGFRRRQNRRGEAYGMAVSELLPPEVLWGYDLLSSAYDEAPLESLARVRARVRQCFPHASDEALDHLIGSPARLAASAE